MPFVIAPALVAVGVSATAASVIGSIASIVIGIGFQLLSSILFKPKQPKPSDGQVVIRQSAAPRFRSYGRVKVAGNLIFVNTKNGYFHRVMAMGSGQIDAIEEHWIDDNVVTLGNVQNSDGCDVTTSQYVVDGASRVRIETRLGDAAPAVYSYLSGQFPTLWTADHLGKGIPSAHVTLWQTKDKQFSDTFPRAGETLYRQVQRGALVPNVSGGVMTASTWSDNAARVILDYLTHADGLRLSATWITNAIDTWGAAIAVCDEAVTLKAGGTEARYRIWNTYRFDERPADVLARFLQSCDAIIYPTPGRGLGIKVGKWETPTVTIDDDSIVAFSEFGRGRDILTTANTIRARFTDPDNDYQENDAQPWTDAADVADRGEISTDIEFYPAPSHAQCRRLMKLAAQRANPDWVGTLRCNLRALPAMGERFVTVQISELDILDTFEIVGSQFIIDDGTILTGIEIQVQSLSSAAYSWDAAAEEGSPPGTAAEIAPERTLPDPSGFAASASGLYVTLSWTAPADDFISVENRYRKTSDSNWLSWPVAEGSNSAVIGPLVDGQEYEFQLRTRSDSTGRTSDWTASQTLTVVSDSTAPSSVTGLTATPNAGANTVLLQWTAPNSANFSKALVKRNTVNTYASATLVQTLYGSANQAQQYNDSTGADGTFYYWIVPCNSSNIEGPQSATGAVVV